MRAPFQVVILPFRRLDRGTEFALFRRSDLHFWQGLAGGGQDDETPVQAARREAFEEAAVPFEAPYFALTRSSSVPVSCISAAARAHWPADLYVIPNHAFAVEVGADFRPVLSREHSAFAWCTYDDAYQRLHFENNQVALEELAQRIADGRLAPIRVDSRDAVDRMDTRRSPPYG